MIDGVGILAVRFEQDLDAVILRDAQRFVQPFVDQEKRLRVGEVVAERGLGIPFRCDDVFDADRGCQAHRLDDLHGAETPRCGRVQQVRVRGPSGDLQAAGVEHALDVERVRVEARHRGETVLDAHAAAVRAVGDVGVLETPIPDAIKLMLKDGKRIDQREASNLNRHITSLCSL